MNNSNSQPKVTNPYSKRNKNEDARLNQPNQSNSHQKQKQTNSGQAIDNAKTNSTHVNNSKKRNVDEITFIDSNDSGLLNLNSGSAITEQSVDSVQPHVLLVSTKQKGNGLLRFVRNVPYTYAKIVPDYILGSNRCALFLSFKYHNLHPNYIHRRIGELKNDFDLRVLLCLVDVEDNANILLELNKMCTMNSISLVLAWSEEECARYLESFKANEFGDASCIQKKKEVTYADQVNDVLGKVRKVNKTDSSQLLMQFGSMKSLVTSSEEELTSCLGIGGIKARRLFYAFSEPFSKIAAENRKKEKERQQNILNIERDIYDVEELSEGCDDHEQPDDDSDEKKHASIDYH